jgi:hypothetical protein
MPHLRVQISRVRSSQDSARDESRDPFPGTSDAGLTLYFIVLAIHWMIQSSVAFGSLVKSQGS